MKLLGLGAALVVLLLAAGCGGGGQQASNAAGLSSLPKSLRSFVHSTMSDSTKDNRIDSINVYGPGSRTALVKASSGGIVYPQGNEVNDTFYLLVLHGHFNCLSCSAPARGKPPTGTIETRVWSPQEGSTDFGISGSVPSAVAKLHQLAAITAS